MTDGDGSPPPGQGGSVRKAMADKPDRVTRGTITIAAERCKGCELCVAACPPGVLSMSAEVNESGYRYPQLHAGCTGCTACQLICPDYVFDVYRIPAEGTRTRIDPG